MATKMVGACLCGAVRFEIAGAFESFFLCHCSRCRKQTGSAHAANLFSSTATITWLAGRDFIRTYRLPASRHARCFCAECGAALPRDRLEADWLVVPAGCLDSDVEMRPDAHIYFASRANWDDHLEAVPKLDGGPGRR